MNTLVDPPTNNRRRRGQKPTPPDARQAALTAVARTLRASVPPSIDELVGRHGPRLLQDAQAFVKAIVDPAGLADRGFHVVDSAAIGIELCACGTGLHLPGLYPLIRDRLPISARPGPVAVIGVEAVLRIAQAEAHEADVATVAALTAQAIAAHEYAHAAVADADQATMPADTTLDEIRRLPRNTDPALARKSHGPRWTRVFAHAMHRARPLWGDHAIEAFAADIRPWTDAKCVLDVLQRELDYTPHDHPLAKVAKRAMPEALANLFPKEARTC